MALGARAGQLRRGIPARTLALAGLGVALVAVASWMPGRAIES
jgi:hypothetical protein